MSKTGTRSGLKGRLVPEGYVPELNIEGTTREAGRYLGAAWGEALRFGASQQAGGTVPWWKHRPYAKLVDRHAAHLPEFYRGMAKGAGLDEDRISSRAPGDAHGCTSFAIAPSATLDGIPISGQTKDGPRSLAMQFIVLRLSLTDEAPSALTLTYQGELFGQGFIQGGCAAFRNSLYTGPTGGTMPYFVWGLLALHCRSVEDVMRLTRDHTVDMSFHTTIVDEGGNVVGIEYGPGGPVFLKPTRGIYAHANAVVSSKRLMRHEEDDRYFCRADSLNRVARLQERLQADRGRLTAQAAFAAMIDHGGYPVSVCRHQAHEAMTRAAVIAEPTRGLLHVVRGPVCQNWPRTHRL